MASLLRVPEVAAGATEVVLAEWLVGERVPVTAGQPIVLIETEKASVEVEAEADAVLLRALVPGGATVAVGAPMAVLGARDEQDTDVDRLLADLGVGASKPGRVFISPIARKLLKESGLSVDHVRGTGPNGRIVRRDVESAVARAKETPAPQPEPEPDGHRDVPASRVRRAVATRLTNSKATIPHFYVKRTARIDALLALRIQLNEVAPVKISVNDLIVRAVGVAHQAVPECNVVWTGDAVRQFESVDVAVAVASARGLVTPVVRDVQASTPSAVAARVQELVARAGDGTLRQQDLEGGSITVSNLGMYGVEEFAAIINPPHSAILAVGAALPTPVVVAGAVEVATQVTLVLSVDHRAIDGALAARWLAALVTALEQPLRLVA
jgi:pyruvate dehydrogenase E2 component (dihydrolipoamide acetyltransferase)